ncbi:MAG: hypothetical protein QM687_09690 [Ferruginibacter sp.]
MKKVIFILSAVFIYCFTNGQSVGIGTAAPNSKAALDISSTTKGLLIPSMTSIQRGLIGSAPDGLMVYDTDQHLFYHYDGGSWRKITNSTFWNNSTSRNYVYNTTDSIGIGTSTPTNRLDVNGNIRTRDTLIVDGRATIEGSAGVAGNLGAGSLSTSGNLTVAGNSILNGTTTANGNVNVSGTVNTDAAINIDNSSAILQLKSNGVNKGFVQLSSDNLRLGTNSGNAQSIIFRLNGNDRTTMYASGDINVDGKVTRQAQTGFNDLLPIAYGRVKADGSIVSGSGNFTITYLSEGEFRIYCSDVTTSSTVIAMSTFSTYYPEVSAAAAYSVGSGIVYVDSYWKSATAKNPSGFTFVIYR